MSPVLTDDGPSRSPRRTLTLLELADMLGASRSFIYELAQTGQLPVPLIRLGHKLVVPRAAVERLLASDAAATQANESDRGAA